MSIYILLYLNYYLIAILLKLQNFYLHSTLFKLLHPIAVSSANIANIYILLYLNYYAKEISAVLASAVFTFYFI